MLTQETGEYSMRMRLDAYIGNRIGSRQRVMKVSSGRQRVNKW